MRPPRSRAFTLLEMVVVLASIGVMASLALPSWRSAQLRGISNDARTVLERLDLQQMPARRVLQDALIHPLRSPQSKVCRALEVCRSAPGCRFHPSIDRSLQPLRNDSRISG